MNVQNISIHRLNVTWGDNCRQEVSAASVEALADSIHVKGLLAPLVVVPNGDRYDLIAGYRRFTAINVHLGWTHIPCNVRTDITREDQAIVNLCENLDREELSLREEGRAIHEAFPKHWSTSRLAKALGRSKEWAAVRLLALTLPAWVLDAEESGRLTKKQIAHIGRSNDPTAMAMAILSDDPALRRKYNLTHSRPKVSEVRAWMGQQMQAGLNQDVLALVAWALGDVDTERRDLALERLSNPN